MVRKAVALLGAISIAGLLQPVNASAFDRSSQPLKVSFDHPIDEAQYDPMVGNDPVGVWRSPGNCKTVTTCDAIPLTLDVPASGVFWKLTFTMTWEAPEANDVDLYLNMETRPDTNTAYTREVVGSAATAGHPEQGKVADLPPSGPLVRYHFVVVNWSGPNAGYHLKTQLTRQTIKKRTTALPTPIKIAESPKGVAPVKASSPKPTLSPVKLPGADGPLTEQELVAIKGQASAEQQAQSALWIIIGVTALVLLGGGAFSFFVIRSRRREEQEDYL